MTLTVGKSTRHDMLNNLISVHQIKSIHFTESDRRAYEDFKSYLNNDPTAIITSSDLTKYKHFKDLNSGDASDQGFLNNG